MVLGWTNPTQSAWGVEFAYSLSCPGLKAVMPESAGRRGLVGGDGLFTKAPNGWRYMQAAFFMHAGKKSQIFGSLES